MVLESIIKIAVLVLVVLGTVAYLVFIERKVSAYIQDRIGPNRVGPKGLFQPFADVLKLVLKELIVPANANGFVHALAPIISITVAISALAVIPFGNYLLIGGHRITLMVANVNVGILFILALSSLGVYGITLSGWASNNKYSLLGGLRSSAQMISYELSLGLSIIGILMVNGTLQLDKVVEAQQGWHWNILYQPLGFLVFIVAAFAETNRLPFDLPEAEPELVGGYHTEYSGMRWGLFFLSEYTNMITSSILMATLYFGGWQLPFVNYTAMNPNIAAIVQILTIMLKTGVFIFIYMWVRWSLPRFRYDQLMNLGWRVLFPLAIVNVFGTGAVLLLVRK
ncbi:MAG: NADH-quinone oxidoreductase subunit NuoH [Candidatus Kryptoniota bacterium]